MALVIFTLAFPVFSYTQQQYLSGDTDQVFSSIFTTVGSVCIILLLIAIKVNALPAMSASHVSGNHQLSLKFNDVTNRCMCECPSMLIFSSTIPSVSDESRPEMAGPQHYKSIWLSLQYIPQSQRRRNKQTPAVLSLLCIFFSF